MPFRRRTLPIPGPVVQPEYPVTVLGVDTAIRCTGYSVVRAERPGHISVLDCGVIRNKASLKHSECLRRLIGGIRELIDVWHPNAASIESAFVHENIRTAMILSLARGAVIAALAEKSVRVFEYSPASAKRAAVGRGGASKEQVAAMMAALFGINVEGIPNDSTDALALAVCHINGMVGAGLSASGTEV